jgi:hypothetical protein
MRTPTRAEASLAKFDAAMREAETHRRELKTRYGFTDAQIGFAVLARRGKTSRHPHVDLAKAFLAAKIKRDTRRTQGDG